MTTFHNMTSPYIRANDVTSIRAVYHDCCLPDYFQGSYNWGCLFNNRIDAAKCKQHVEAP